MKCKVDRAKLLKAVLDIETAIDEKHLTYRYLKLGVFAGVLTVQGASNSASAVRYLKTHEGRGCETEGGEVLIEPDKLKALCRDAVNHTLVALDTYTKPVTYLKVGSQIEPHAEGSIPQIKHQGEILSSDELGQYRPLPDDTGELVCTFDPRKLKASLGVSLICGHTGDDSLTTGGYAQFLLEFAADEIYFVTTDSVRLAVVQPEILERKESCPKSRRLLIPNYVLACLRRMVKPNGPPVEMHLRDVSSAPASVTFTQGDTEIHGSDTERTFPTWKQILPGKQAIQIKLYTNIWAQTLAGLAKHSRAAKCRGKLTLHAETTDEIILGGYGKEIRNESGSLERYDDYQEYRIACSHNAEADKEMFYNLGYLDEVIAAASNVVPAGEPITWEMSKPHYPADFKIDARHRVILMPISS
jgi:hypothetical protein